MAPDDSHELPYHQRAISGATLEKGESSVRPQTLERGAGEAVLG
ncbi:hypothetical protein PENDEC_c003G00444 [Penicillium decumbens]|uniref:Uncharacterized protein n=1 Tax=Penicillium decumbens TaxID=69771 RepID=A0A1V6PKV0_PENDC|nr:hypothetical protein PENDEC_c003G00444 [Penicillium decumbens]